MLTALAQFLWHLKHGVKSFSVCERGLEAYTAAQYDVSAVQPNSLIGGRWT